MRNLRFLIVLLVSVGLLASCASGSSAPAPTATPVPVPVSELPSLEPLFLEISSPRNESIVTSRIVTIQGRTVPNAVVTVNASLVSVAADGGFTTSMTMQEGPNFIEVIASNLEGEEAAVTLSLIYLP